MHFKCCFMIFCLVLCNFTKIVSFSVSNLPTESLEIILVLKENGSNCLFIFKIVFQKKSGGGAYNQILFEILRIGIISLLKKISTGIALAGS